MVKEETKTPLMELNGDDIFRAEVVGHTTIPGAVFTFVCTTVGAGILALPGAFKAGGWMSILIVIVVSAMCNTTAKLLISCMHSVPGKRLATYEDIGEAVLGRPGRHMISVFQLTTLIGVSTIFLILIGGNMHAMVSSLKVGYWVLIFGAVMIPFAWLKTMREISFLAYFGTFASVFVGIVVIVLGIKNHADHPGQHKHQILGDNLSVAFNTIVFSYGGHSVFPAIEYTMAEPQRWPLVTNISYVIITAAYGLVGAFGYLGWGVDTEGNILTNMDQKAVIVIVATAIITSHVVFAYPIPLNPVNLYLEEVLGFPTFSPRKELLFRVILRTCVVLFTILVAYVVPDFPDILSLVSALSVIAVAFIFPPLFYFELNRTRRFFPLIELFWYVLIMVVGVAGTCFGLYFSIQQLVHDIEHPNSS